VPLRYFIYVYRLSSIGLLLMSTHGAAATGSEAASVGCPDAEERSSPPVKASTPETVVLSTPRDVHATTNEPRSFLRGFVADQKAIWTSPSRMSRGDLRWILPLAVGTGVAIATDHSLTEHLPNPDDPAKVVGKQVSQLGAAYTLAGISAGTYLVGRFARKERVRDTGWLGLEALAHTQIVVQGLKLATQRERPPEPKARRGFWTGGSSFPSGHAATSWAWATIVARQYGDKKIVPITVYSLAAVVSAARLSARRHYASDILVGGAIGHLIGRYLHDVRQHRDQRASARGSLTPRVGLRYSRPARHYALNLSWSL
jgi:membrane-associated phospholipid phosphatase